jgi:hypothetical protein
MSSGQCHGHGLIGDDGEIVMESLFLQFRSNRAQYTIANDYPEAEHHLFDAGGEGLKVVTISSSRPNGLITADST